MPPNYGIVDHIAFYHSDVVEGSLPQAIGEVVDCEAIPNVDGGKYEWRLIKVALSRSGRVRHKYCMPNIAVSRCCPAMLTRHGNFTRLQELFGVPRDCSHPWTLSI